MTRADEPTEAGTPINKALFDKIMPSGLICMWSGSIIPKGWYLCDGTNGTPDLRNRFIVGAGDEYDIGTTGGEKQHVLTIDEMPSHTHIIQETTVSKKFTVRDSLNANSGTNLAGNGSSGASGSFTINMGDHTHIAEETGGGKAQENRPPYYALAYIMKA
ncbi:MAG: hypothetical protein J6B87_02845 [Clostridia bacterium]|nr:hypothetical protein [Clostridia bacterium]